MHVSDEILKRVSDAYRRMRNTQRFLLGNLHGFDHGRDAVPLGQMVALDRWAVEHARALQHELVRAYDRFEFHHIYQKVHNFCVIEMGGFYLDVIKDRLYTTPRAGLPRRSAQTAMYHIAEAMVRWLAPILSFTAEEIWRALPGERAESVFLATWHRFPEAPTESALDWAAVLDVRQGVARELERLRADDRIGAPLDARVHIYCDGALNDTLAAFGDELRFVFITSDVDVRPSDGRPDAAVAGAADGAQYWLDVTPTTEHKCVRCWHRRADVGADPDHPELCARCVANVAGPGETRAYA